jgi:hypothetical protein
LRALNQKGPQPPIMPFARRPRASLNNGVDQVASRAKKFYRDISRVLHNMGFKIISLTVLNRFSFSIQNVLVAHYKSTIENAMNFYAKYDHLKFI